MKLIAVDIKNGEIPLWIEVVCSERDKVVRLLKERNIQAKPFDPALSDLFRKRKKDNFKFSRLYARSGLILASGPAQTKKDITYVVQALKEIHLSKERFNLIYLGCVPEECLF